MSVGELDAPVGDEGTEDDEFNEQDWLGELDDVVADFIEDVVGGDYE